VLTSKYRPPYKRYAAISLGIGLALFLTWLYDYGTPIGYELIATLISGEEVILGPDQAQVHLAYTPLYSAAMEWRIFVNSAWQYILALTGILGPLWILGRYVHKIYGYIMRHRRNGKGSSTGPKDSPSKSPPYGPYGFRR